MPWREHLITTRRHPLALAAYLLTFCFGILFATDVLSTSAVFDPLAHFWRLLWEWELVTGGGIAFLSLAKRPKHIPGWPDLADLLRFEGIGAIVGGIGMLTYAVVLIKILGAGSYSWTLMTILSIGMIVRGVQAITESVQIERLGNLNAAAQEVVEKAAVLSDKRQFFRDIQ
jgi:hypothetical protein